MKEAHAAASLSPLAFRLAFLGGKEKAEHRGSRGGGSPREASLTLHGQHAVPTSPSSRAARVGSCPGLGPPWLRIPVPQHPRRQLLSLPASVLPFLKREPQQHLSLGDVYVNKERVESPWPRVWLTLSPVSAARQPASPSPSSPHCPPSVCAGAAGPPGAATGRLLGM